MGYFWIRVLLTQVYSPGECSFSCAHMICVAFYMYARPQWKNSNNGTGRFVVGQACPGGSPYTRKAAILDSSRGLSTLRAKACRMLQGEQFHSSPKKGLFTTLQLDKNRDHRIPARLFGQASPQPLRTFQETWPLNPGRGTAQSPRLPYHLCWPRKA